MNYIYIWDSGVCGDRYAQPPTGYFKSHKTIYPMKQFKEVICYADGAPVKK